MEQFIQEHDSAIAGVLSGFDRLVLRGTLRMLSFTAGMMTFLSHAGVLLKDFGAYAEETTNRLKDASLAAARELERPIKYLPSSGTRKEDVAREIAAADNVTEGLLTVLTCVEPCQSYELYRDRQAKRLVLEPRRRKCLHLYHYWIDPVFGFMSARIQTWFPFPIQVCVNGREWLARQLDREGIRYRRSDNCFPWVEDFPRAQALFEKMLTLSWSSFLDSVGRRLNPCLDDILGGFSASYYWSVHQSEWATDVVFRSPRTLARLYPLLTQGALTSFASADVMRFLGGRQLTGTFAGEVVSDYRSRHEGVRVKHQVKANSIKLYDKHPCLLRTETTLNDPADFKVFRPKEGEPDGERGWRTLRKGIADLHRRAQLSQEANNRYLNALACLNTDRRFQELVEPVCRRVRWKGKPVRGLRPWSEPDRRLLETINRGEYALNGFRNRDLATQLLPTPKNDQERKRYSARVTRQLRLLRAHGLIRKSPHTHRYRITPKGQQLACALTRLRELTLQTLNQAAPQQIFAGKQDSDG